MTNATMFDTGHTASHISDTWGHLGVKLPKPLTHAISVFDETQFVHYEPPVIEVETITVENVADTIGALAEELSQAAITEIVPGTSNGTRAWDHARNMVRNRLAREVLHQAGAAVPGIIEQLTPRFDEAVEGFRNALGRMPERLDSDSLVAAGADALLALGEAREHVRVIKQADSWLADLSRLPAYAGTIEPALRVFAPETTAQLQVLEQAQRKSDSDPVMRELRGLYVSGIRAGVPMQLNTPRDIARIRTEIV